MDVHVAFESLTASYGAKVALRDISLQMPRNQIFKIAITIIAEEDDLFAKTSLVQNTRNMFCKWIGSAALLKVENACVSAP